MLDLHTNHRNLIQNRLEYLFTWNKIKLLITLVFVIKRLHSNLIAGGSGVGVVEVVVVELKYSQEPPEI